MKRSFLTGLVILLPLAVTVAVIAFLINLLTGPFTGMVEAILDYYHIGIHKEFLFLSSYQAIHLLSQALVLITLFIVTVGLGALARMFFFHALLKMGDYVLARIPLVNKVYKTTQDIIKTLLGPQKNAFKQVVMVPFPRAGIFSIGLIAGDGLAKCSEAAGEMLVTVFIPTTPNPTSGYLLMFKHEDVVLLDIKVEDALKYIISCGVITEDVPEIHEL